MRPEARAATRAGDGEGVSRRGIEILAKSIYRELCDRGCKGPDVIRLATALLDQIITGKTEHSANDQLTVGSARLLSEIAREEAA
jgi:hypothetical protein